LLRLVRFHFLTSLSFALVFTLMDCSNFSLSTLGLSIKTMGML
jgi:hypothetical protein